MMMPFENRAHVQTRVNGEGLVPARPLATGALRLFHRSLTAIECGNSSRTSTSGLADELGDESLLGFVRDRIARIQRRRKGHAFDEELARRLTCSPTTALTGTIPEKSCIFETSTMRSASWSLLTLSVLVITARIGAPVFSRARAGSGHRGRSARRQACTARRHRRRKGASLTMSLSRSPSSVRGR